MHGIYRSKQNSVFFLLFMGDIIDIGQGIAKVLTLIFTIQKIEIKTEGN